MATKKRSSADQREVNALVKLERNLNELAPKMMKQIAKGVDINHQIGATIALARANERLLSCTLVSLLDCLVEANRQGLNLHPGLKHAYMVPFYNKNIRQYEAKLIIDYRGFIAKAVSQGMIKDADVFIVKENDEFEYGQRFIGAKNESHLTWKPNEDEAERGETTHVVAAFTLPDDTVKWRVMTRSRVEEIRKRSPSGRSKKSSPWDTDYDEMAAKTALKWGFKLIPARVEFAELLANDNAVEGWDDILYRQDGETIDVEVVEQHEEHEEEPKPAAKSLPKETKPSSKAPPKQATVTDQWEGELAGI